MEDKHDTLLQRLRAYVGRMESPTENSTLIEAADEIERLTAEVESSNSVLSRRQDKFCDVMAERDRLLVALKWAQQDAIARGHYGTAEIIGASLRPAASAKDEHG